MRQLKISDIEKRGCRCCADRTLADGYSHCPYEECPYHELDKVKNYGEYLKKSGKVSTGDLMRTMK